MMRQLRSVGLIFAFLGIVFIPASFKISHLQNYFAPTYFSWIGKFLSKEHLTFESDTIELYILLFVLLLSSIVIYVILKQLQFWKLYGENVLHLLTAITVYYLANRMFVYGFDKITKSQFFIPEPNTLYTPVGILDKDILYWTSMGSSYWFSILTGAVEILAAVLLIFKRTRITGLLVLTFILANVLIVNLSFDISVKLYSSFLLGLTLLLLAPQFTQIIRFLKGQPTQLKKQESSFEFLKKPFLKTALKSFVIGIMLLDMSFYSMTSGNFNDDFADRPALHGAYEVEHQNALDVKRFFIHRRGFFILQYEDDQFQDFALTVDEQSNILKLVSYSGEMNLIPYKLYDEAVEIELFESTLLGQQLDWRSLPLLKDDIHWTIESY